MMLRNAAGDRAVSMGFAVAELPYVTLWKNLTALDEGYVTGLEPGTGFPYTRRLEREAGRVPKLKPGETRRFAIDVGLHTTAAGVTAVERTDHAHPERPSDANRSRARTLTVWRLGAVGAESNAGGTALRERAGPPEDDEDQDDVE